MTVQVTPQTVQFVAGLEGFTPVAQWDGSQYSYGYGTKAPGLGAVIDQASAQAALVQELNRAANYVNSVAPNYQPTGGGNDSIISAAFNLGSFGPGLIGALSTNDPQAIASHLSQYTGTQVPGTGQGIVNRRNAEVANLLGGQATPVFSPAPIQLASYTPSATPPVPTTRPEDLGPQFASATDIPPLPQLSPADNLVAPPPTAQAPETSLTDPFRTTPASYGNEATSLPAGPLGAQALVQALLTGDPQQIQAAQDQIKSAAVAQYGLGLLNPALQAQVTQQIDQYLTQTVPQAAPGLVRSGLSQLAGSGWDGLSADNQQLVTQAMANLPPAPVPMPNLSPLDTGTATDAPASALTVSVPADQSVQPPDSRFATFDQTVQSAQPSSDPWASTPYGASPDYGSVASTVADALSGGISSLFGGTADASTAGGADTSGSYLGPPIPLGNAAIPPAPSQSFIPESDYTAVQAGFVPESDYTLAASGALSGGLLPSAGSPGSLDFGAAFVPESDYSEAQRAYALRTGTPQPIHYTAAASPPKPAPLPPHAGQALGVPFGVWSNKGATLPMAAAPATGLGGLPFPTLPNASPAAYSGSMGSSNYTFDPTKNQGVYTYVDPTTGQAGGTFNYNSNDQQYGGSDYVLPGGGGF